MDKKVLIYAFALLIVAGGVGIVGAGAHIRGDFDFTKDRGERFEKMLDHKATLLGLTTEELKAELESGKTFKEIVEDQGLTKEDLKSQFQQYKLTKIEDHLSQAVADGELTQEEADEKLAKMKEKHESGSWPHKNKGWHGGFKKF